jgi:hypothetical protein
MGTVIQEWWAVLMGAFAAVVWLVRLEARGIANAAEIRRLWAQRKEDLASAKESRDRTDKRLDVIGADIKLILQHMPKD